MISPANSRQVKDHLQEQFGLSAEQVEDLLPLFLKTLGAYLIDLETAVAAHDLPLLTRNAHTIKGALLNLGLKDSAEQARVIELLARTGNESTDYGLKAAELRQGLADYLD